MGKEEQLNQILGKLEAEREKVLERYLANLNAYSIESPNLTMDCVNAAGFLHDIDRHITNVNGEIKRIGAIKHMKNVSVSNG
jgi:hypothetical protein